MISTILTLATSLIGESKCGEMFQRCPLSVTTVTVLFSDSVPGVKASANLYFLVESAEANGLDPYQYLSAVFTMLPQAETVEDIEQLLPGAVKKISAATR